VHNVSQRRKKKTEPLPWATCTENLVKFGCVVFAICKRTNRRSSQQGSRRRQTPPPVLGAANWEVTVSARKVCARVSVGLQLVLLRTVYSQAQGCVWACCVRFSWAATSSSLGLFANMTSSIKPEVHNISLRRQRRTEPRPLVSCTKN